MSNMAATLEATALLTGVMHLVLLCLWAFRIISGSHFSSPGVKSSSFKHGSVVVFCWRAQGGLEAGDWNVRGGGSILGVLHWVGSKVRSMLQE